MDDVAHLDGEKRVVLKYKPTRKKCNCIFKVCFKGINQHQTSKMAINKELLPVKAHFFFFMAASGPILPYLIVFGKQLGISEMVMGNITATIPITFLLAKPAFGFLADYFYEKRKFIFMALIMAMSLFYLSFYFIPPVNIDLKYAKSNTNFSTLNFCNESEVSSVSHFNNSMTDKFCNVSCLNKNSMVTCQILGLNDNRNFCYLNEFPEKCNWTEIPMECHDDCLLQISKNNHIFRSHEFYEFIILMSLAMIFYNVSNSISDAICFDVLAGEGGEKKYGFQRVWGTIGFGITAFLGGVGMDLWSNGNVKNYQPGFLMVIIFTFLDLLCCRKLKLPKIQMSQNILKDLSKVLQTKAIALFLMFVTLVGVLDGFIIYFLFWFLEDLAAETNQMNYVKALEGLTLAAETLGGEIIFFLLSEKILKVLGYGHTLSLCFFNYALRLCLISLITNPWWILGVELIMQGPTYALCYTAIVAYANAIAPSGTSATMQGIIAGVDDGFGYSLGSLLGGFLYKTLGGRLTFQIFSGLSILCCIAHVILYRTILSTSYNKDHLKGYKSPSEALTLTDTASR